MKPLNIILADLVHDYRPNHFTVPLGIGFIKEYLNSKFGQRVSITLVKSPGKLLKMISENESIDVLGLSNYSWNYEINKHVSQCYKESNPSGILIQGGPHIRVDPEGIKSFLLNHPLVDYYTMFEGEFPTGNLVEQILLCSRSVRNHTLDCAVPGVAYLCSKTHELVYQPHHSKKGDLDQIPSPILSGALDEFLESPYYLPLLETNRGCPFACTFCAWGISVLNKVRKFDLDRIIAEIDYVSKISKATNWYFTDANFGMFERDIEIAKAIKKAAQNSKYFQRLSINWAKNSSKYCMEIQHILSGITDPLVAVQSTDAFVLKNIKRDNIKMETITDLVDQGRKDSISMTTDVLSGLAGETLESHLNTLRDVFSIGFDSFNVGQIRMLPGSEMETDEYREKYGLKTQYRLIAGFYGLYEGKPIAEFEESVVETNSMSRSDMWKLRKIHFLAWALWNSGLAQPLLRYLHKVENINPLDSILQVMENQKDVRLKKFFADFEGEIKHEWFDTEEELLSYFDENYEQLIKNEYLKLNLKYLAKLLLDRDLASAVIKMVASISKNEHAEVVANFCLERMVFVNELVKNKEVKFEDSLVEALRCIYPTIRGNTGPVCQFSTSEKMINAINWELERFDFAQDPVRAVALALQNYGDKLFYDFSFGGDRITQDSAPNATDSFDYSDQFSFANRA